MTMLTTSDVLEALHRARASLNDEDQEYAFWSYDTCTCGHIYRGATGRESEGDAGGYNGVLESRYKEVIMATAKALGWAGDDAGAAIEIVSDRTKAQTVGVPRREDALAVINEAIAVIEAEQERDRLDVLAQARTVIDDAATLRPVYNAATHAIEFVEAVA